MKPQPKLSRKHAQVAGMRHGQARPGMERSVESMSSGASATQRERDGKRRRARERESATEKCRAELSVQAEASHVCERVNRTEIKSHKDTEKKENEK